MTLLTTVTACTDTAERQSLRKITVSALRAAGVKQTISTASRRGSDRPGLWRKLIIRLPLPCGYAIGPARCARLSAKERGQRGVLALRFLFPGRGECEPAPSLFRVASER